MVFEPALVKTWHQSLQELCSQLFFNLPSATGHLDRAWTEKIFIFHRSRDWPKFSSYMFQVKSQNLACMCAWLPRKYWFFVTFRALEFFSLFASLFPLRESRSGGFPCSSVFQLLDFLTFHLPYKFRTRSSQANGEIQLGCSVPTRFSELESLESK